MIESPLLPLPPPPAAGSPTISVTNPATGELLANLPDEGEDAAARAIESAARAMRESAPAPQRSLWLAEIARLMLENKRELARIITLEQGKPLKESTIEVEYAAGFFSFFANQLEHLAAEPLDPIIRNCRWTIHHRPAGVVALITPWNFPLAMLAKKLAPALGAGCGVVVKPADLTPLSAIAQLEILRRVGVPEGLCNLVIGRPDPIGKVFCSHPLVRLISFTGSTRVGSILMRDSAPHIKRLALELGGNAPFIVFADADLDLTADALIANKFRAAGQTCVCANRIYVHRDVLDAFVDRAIARCAKLRVGNGMDEGVDIGPLINRSAFEKVSRHVRDAIDRGARRVFGSDPPTPVNDWGCFYPPTILVDVKPDMLVCREETFGPVVAISTFGDEREVIDAANSTPYGLAAYVFSRDAARIDRVVPQLIFGHVAVNSGTGPTPEAPFGGMKQSGLGREGGVEGLLEFCETQTVAKAQ